MTTENQAARLIWVVGEAHRLRRLADVGTGGREDDQIVVPSELEEPAVDPEGPTRHTPPRSPGFWKRAHRATRW